jgi:1,4-dihydroxy-2-naphthoyl-CoA hydrolase
MAIWFNKTVELSNLKGFTKNTMADFLGIEWTEIGDDFLEISMPVNERTKQPYGILHGGASCVLAETVGSIASALVIDMDKFYCVGLEINANHVKSVTEGLITAKCIPLHLGKHTHVWDIKIYDNNRKLICISRLTVAIIPKKQQ